jgi:hypothetical protein
LGIAALVLGHAKHMESVEVVWMFFQDFYVTGLSLGDISGMMARARPGEQVGDVVTYRGGRIRVKLRLLIHPAVTF